MRASVHGTLMCVHRRHFKKACFVVLFPLGCWRNQVGGAERRGWACTPVGDMLCGGHTSTCLRGVVPRWCPAQMSALGCRASKPNQTWGESETPLPSWCFKKNSITKGGERRTACRFEMDSTVMATERDKGPKNSFVFSVSSRLMWQPWTSTPRADRDSLSFHSG